MLLFLGAWFLLSDGIATISGTAVSKARTRTSLLEADMQPGPLREDIPRNEARSSRFYKRHLDALRRCRRLHMEQALRHDEPEAHTDHPGLHLPLRADTAVWATRLHPGGTPLRRVWLATALGNVPAWSCLRLRPRRALVVLSELVWRADPAGV